jgi:polyisoprenoid-binding protein YceI
MYLLNVSRWRLISSLAVSAVLFSQNVLAAPTAYKLDPAKSTLQFVFTQAGAKNDGKFAKYDVSFTPESNALNVVVQVSSLDTGDKDRDSTLRSADLFNVAKFPQAKFAATKITHGAGDKYEAVGKLTIRDISRDVKIPLTFKTANEGGKQVGVMTGEVLIKRLDYGVGQGEWKSTEWVDNDVTVKFSLKLAAP